jgi:DNA-binding MarR family transcriptional regulator
MEARFETFTVLINRISRNVRKIKNQEMEHYGLRSVHVSCLYYLYAEEGLTSTELCERCEEDKATVSRALVFLQEQGYLQNSDAVKRYKSPLLLTERGREVGKTVAEKVAKVLDAVSGGLTEAERVSFYRSLAVISESLEALSQKEKSEA